MAGPSRVAVIAGAGWVTEAVICWAWRGISQASNPLGTCFVEQWVRWGAGLRASQALILGGKARALMRGRYHVSVTDVRALAAPTLRHRLVTNFFAESEGVDAEKVIERLLDVVPSPSSGM